MKLSLRIKVTLILTVSLALMIFLCWFLNQTFLGDYYQYTKRQSLSEWYSMVDTLTGKGDEGWDDAYADGIERLEAAAGMNIFIMSESTDKAGTVYLEFLYPNAVYFTNIKAPKFERIKNALSYYIFRGAGGNAELLESVAGKYDIYKLYDTQMDAYYIDLVGYLDNGLMVFIRTNFESIQESAAVSNKFLGFMGIIVTLLGTVFMFLFSRSFTKPIRELSTIAGKMSELDFDAKYTVDREDEIGELGHSINTLSERLEHTISELKTANVELQRDIARKTQIDEMRKDFLSNVSHELKTPIALIQGYAEGLQENISDDPESREFYCEVIIDEAMKMNKMVKKLLTLNQIEFGSNQAEMERFDIVELSRSVISASDILLKQKEINVVFGGNSPVFVWADQYMIEEVITNYLSNAINHIGGRRVIDVGFRVEGGRVRVSVFNTGDQIPEEDLDKIWIKFYKVDKARTREYGGSGIGLSIVKAILDAHNRECGVINHEDGVEFWFELDTSVGEE